MWSSRSKGKELSRKESRFLCRASNSRSCLRDKVLIPSVFVEFDGTEHQVLAFDPRPVYNSDFTDCVTHSLALTDRGLFEVGRYAATSLSELSRVWKWFIHQGLLTAGELDLLVQSGQVRDRILDRVYGVLIGNDAELVGAG